MSVRYNEDFKKEVVKTYMAGNKSTIQIAADYNIAKSMVSQWVNLNKSGVVYFWKAVSEIRSSHKSTICTLDYSPLQGAKLATALLKRKVSEKNPGGFSGRANRTLSRRRERNPKTGSGNYDIRNRHRRATCLTVLHISNHKKIPCKIFTPCRV